MNSITPAAPYGFNDFARTVHRNTLYNAFFVRTYSFSYCHANRLTLPTALCIRLSSRTRPPYPLCSDAQKQMSQFTATDTHNIRTPRRREITHWSGHILHMRWCAYFLSRPHDIARAVTVLADALHLFRQSIKKADSLFVLQLLAL